MFQSPGPYLRTDATVIANDWTDLTDGFLNAAIEFDENGVTRSASVWTNTQANGNSAGGNHCSDWTGTGLGGVGTASATVSGDWTDNGIHPCNVSDRLYCFGQ